MKVSDITEIFFEADQVTDPRIQQLQAQVDARAKANIDPAYNRWNVYAEKIPDINDLAKSPPDYYSEVVEFVSRIMGDPIPANIVYPTGPLSIDSVKQVIYQVTTNHFNLKAAKLWQEINPT